ncbi:primosomal replication protein [Vibrio hepatarius]|uniref:primosomal replication protein n=1 Tax=Vibrio hepatarius TaxID=171383 RepID=UPI001C09B8D4|nr:primosomal replication protein [Vibrio hepatarius]MBU2897840.1 primosomal replication protein [Vibrio hepatarius]
MKPLSELSNLLAQLESQAKLKDQKYGEHHQALFDQSLFRCQAKQLHPYVNEAQSTLDRLAAQLKSGTETVHQAHYLSEKLICQIDAIKKELSSFQVRQQEHHIPSPKQSDLNRLYQHLAQHHEWELSLKNMVSQYEQEYRNATGREKALASQKLTATQRRLQRCQQAKLKIEKHITYKERNQ